MDKKGKFSRKRANEDEGDITYINEHNRVFNKKVRLPQQLILLLRTYEPSPTRRLPGITTSTLRRSARVSSVVLLSNLPLAFNYFADLS